MDTSAAAVLERSQWDLFWLPADTLVVERLDFLQVVCPRPTPYLNSVLRVRVGADRADAVVAEASERFAPGVGRFMVTDTWDSGPLVRSLAAAGWAEGDHHDVRVLDVDRWVSGARVPVRRVEDMATLRDCVAAAGRAFGRADTSSAAELEADLRACTVGGRVRRFVAYDGSEPIGAGGLTAFPDLGFGLLWAGAVVPEARGRGAYRALLDARVAEARRMGLSRVGLYARVGTSNPIVARLGFERHGSMTFWDRGLAC